MAVALDRRSYFGLTRSRFTADGSEPKPAFRRLGTVRPELRALLSPEGVRKYHGLLFLGYICSLLAGLMGGVALGSQLLVDLLAAMQSLKELTPFFQDLYRILAHLPVLRFVFMAIPLFVLAFAIDYLSYRSILETIDGAAEPAPEEPAA
jgi:hypothetical protein